MKISRVEAQQYILAEKRLNQVIEQYQDKRQEVYDMIHPTQQVPNYELGKLEIHSMNPLEFAIRLCDIEEEYKQEVKHLKEKVKVFNQIKKNLTNDDLNSLNNLFTVKKIQGLLSDVVTPSDNKKLIYDMYKHDEEVENMTEKELLNDYVDYIGR